MKCFDAHNHLQDDRFAGCRERLIEEAMAAGVAAMVVNGACESDWPDVAELARRHPGWVIPSFGYHPWYLHERTVGWQAALVHWLDTTPGAVVGEIGIDRWILEQPPGVRTRYAPALANVDPAPIEDQEAVFTWQLELAADRNLAASIHCLDAFGRLDRLLRMHRVPARGFLLHSYGGPAEMVPGFVSLGARFSFPGYFAHERKARRLETFRAIPLERLLVETDAPDQLPPESLMTHRVPGDDGARLNHPANLPAIQRYLTDVLGQPHELFAARLEGNFRALFTPTGPA